MELIARRKIFPTLIILILIRESFPSDTPVRNSSVYDTGWSKPKLVYRMLMEYEHQKNKLVKNFEADAIFGDLYVVQANDLQKVKDICRKYGLVFVRKVFEDENYYLFRRSDCGKRCRRYAEGFMQEAEEHAEIQWTSRQSLEDRVRRVLPLDFYKWADGRQLFSEIRNLIGRKALHQKSPYSNLTFNDPLFKDQWYLYNRGQTGSPPKNDMNVLPVWQSGITGRGVIISVLDDGVNGQSEEVAANYVSEFSDEYITRTPGFKPIPENSHGTRCAAVAAGVANNNVCGVGVAYEAKVAGVRILEGPMTDVQEAMSLVHALNHVDIYTASWGPNDKGQAVEGPKILTRLAFIKGISMGRQGKGSIYVWAAGNGGAYRDNCSLDGYASSPFTLTIGALTEDGRSTFYSEPCPAVIASTYVGGESHKLPSKEAWKKDKKKIKVVVPEGRGKCKETFQGTSAAAPIAAGVVALALQANPDLTWRDVQHLIIRTSRVPAPREKGWIANGVGFHFHPKIGSGVLDSHALVTLARTWKLVGNLHVWTTPVMRLKRVIPPKKCRTFEIKILRSSMEPSQPIDRLETVVVTANIGHAHRGDLALLLKSPSGTPSRLLTRRIHDNSTSGFDHWDFVSLHFWGENPEGVWTLKVSNYNTTITGFVNYLSITLYGTGKSSDGSD